MNEPIQERSRMHASIVISGLTSYQVASNMSALTQERSRIHASTVRSVLACYQIVSDMNKNTQKTIR